MGTVIIVGWLIAVLILIFALVNRFDPGAGDLDREPANIPKDVPSRASGNGGAT